jgi:cyclase
MPAIRWRQAQAYDAAGADELCFLDITAFHENRGTIFDVVRPHGGTLLHAADRRRRRAHGRGCPQAAAGRRRQGVDQHRRRPTPDFVAEAADKFGNQCIVVAIDAKKVGAEARPIAGRSSPMAAASRPASTPSTSQEKVVELGAGEILLTSMDRDGTNSRLQHAADPRDRRRRAVPVIASGGVGTLDHLVEGIRDGHATAVLAASIFHFGTYTIAEAKESYGRRRASTCV